MEGTGEGYDLAAFLANPLPAYVDCLRKDDWIKVVDHYSITLPGPPSKLRKSVIKDLAIKHLVGSELMVNPYLPETEDEELDTDPTNTSPEAQFKQTHKTSTKPQGPPSSSAEVERYRIDMQYRLEQEKTSLGKGKTSLG